MDDKIKVTFSFPHKFSALLFTNCHCDGFASLWVGMETGNLGPIYGRQVKEKGSHLPFNLLFIFLFLSARIESTISVK